MAESDNRLETLEDEVKVLKGEVKRTLVDLRALLMREDSPLSEGAIAGRAAATGKDPAGDTGSQEQKVVNISPTPQSSPASPGSGQPSQSQESYPAPVAAPSQEGAPGLANAPAAPQVQQVIPSYPTPPPAPPSGGLGSAEHELRMAEQERRMAEQGIDQERRLADHERRLAEQEERLLGGDREGLDSNGQGHGGEPGEEYHPRPDRPGPERPSTYEEREWMEGHFPPGPGGRVGRVTPLWEAGLEVPQGSSGWPEDGGDAGADAREGQDPADSRVFDEYRALLEEHLDMKGAIEDAPEVAGRPLDVNLLSNLMYWAALAKQQVGEEQLRDVLELYIQSGHSRPELQKLLLHISGMVDAAPSRSASQTQVCVDLMFHLHGILTGGLPVIKIPQVRLAGPGDAGPDLGV